MCRARQFMRGDGCYNEVVDTDVVVIKVEGFVHDFVEGFLRG